MSGGRVYIVGAGPGDPKLITVRGRELIERADVLLYDALVGPQLLQWAPAACERLYVGKRAGSPGVPQEEINAMLVRLARAGKRVVRLKGGDPFVYGRGAEEALACHEAGVEFEVVPGVTSAIAVPASAGIPVLHRELAGTVLVLHGRLGTREAVDISDRETRDGDDSASRIVVRRRRHESSRETVLPSPEKAGVRGVEVQEDSVDADDGADDFGAGAIDWKAACAAADTLVVLMAAGRLEEIRAGLLEGGRAPDQPVAVIQWGTLPAQRTVVSTVDAFPRAAAAAGLGSPAVIVAGGVVALRQQLNTFESRPLFGWRVAVAETGPPHAELAEALAEAGAQPILIPVATPAPLGAGGAEIAAISASFNSATHVLVTSADLVEPFLRGAALSGLDVNRLLGGKMLLATTTESAQALKVFGFDAHMTGPSLRTGDIEALLLRPLRQCRIVVLEHEDEWYEGSDALDEAGAELYALPIADETPDEHGIRRLAGMLAEGTLEALYLPSPDAVAALRRGLGEERFQKTLGATILAAADERTAHALEKAGLTVHIPAAGESPAALVGRLAGVRDSLGGQATARPVLSPASPAKDSIGGG